MEQAASFRQVTIIGIGLIGSSIARALRRAEAAEKIVAADLSQEACTVVRDELGIVDVATTDIAASVRGSDLVILCVPVGALASIAEAIGPALESGAIVTDTGSVKHAAIEAIAPHLPDHAHFVPGHPVAGTEQSGPRAGFAELFEGRWWLMTPLSATDPQILARLSALWQSFGARVECMRPDHHDLALAITSHLPHLIAYTAVGTAAELEEDTRDDVIRFSAGGFRDFTRVAASDPAMWRDIFLNNRDSVLEILQRFTEDLSAMQRAIRRGDGEYLFDHFTRARGIRRAIIEAGQANYVYPKAEDAAATPHGEVPRSSAARASGRGSKA